MNKVLIPFHAVISQEVIAAENIYEIVSRVSAVGICLSAIVTLYSAHSCAELDDPRGVGIPEQLKVQQMSLDGLLKVGSSACEFATKLLRLLETQSIDPTVGLFATESFYQVARLYLLYVRETNKVEEYSPRIEVLTETLRFIGRSLQVASKITSIS